jgi:hypothetical protein
MGALDPEHLASEKGNCHSTSIVVLLSISVVYIVSINTTGFPLSKLSTSDYFRWLPCVRVRVIGRLCGMCLPSARTSKLNLVCRHQFKHILLSYYIFRLLRSLPQFLTLLASILHQCFADRTLSFSALAKSVLPVVYLWLPYKFRSFCRTLYPDFLH